ncbi:MAG: hypothetical protein Q8N36_06270 [bacterium]|nr:hypothetical protein [bacterium]
MLTTEIIMLRALERGLTLQDFDLLTVGMLIDYIVAYNAASRPDSEQTESARERLATQQDYNRF